MPVTDFARLRTEIEGDVFTGAFDRGRYATDASIYQIMPRAIVVPKQWSDVEATLAFARAGRACTAAWRRDVSGGADGG